MTSDNMITKLKRRFIALAMASLVVLLSAIVAGINIINYNTVIRNADSMLEMLSGNRGRMPMQFDEEFAENRDLPPDVTRPGSGRGPGGFTRDEAEESRFFTVLLDSGNKAVVTDTDRIYAVDEDQAAEYAVKAAASGKEKGFIDDYRYSVISEGSQTRVTFLDCGRTLDAFRNFLRASILMSVIGLAVLFAAICYFAGRIVRPAAESYEKQKRFITDAGHEIKTPLAVIKANIDLMKMDLEDGTDTEALAESLDEIDIQVERLTSLTNDLVYLSRLEEKGGKTEMTAIDFSEMTLKTSDAFGPVAQKKDISILTDIEPGLRIRGSEEELRKLVSILLENALKYSPEGETVRLALKKEGRGANLEVRNRTTNELTDSDLAHIFDRFYRADQSRNSETGGYGIGLSVAYAIVTQHGGRIRAEKNNGGDFIITAVIP